MNTLKIGQHCPVHKGIYAGIARSFSSEPDNHIWLLDAKSPNELMNWTDAMEWAESLGEAANLPTRYEAALLGCNLAEELGNYGYVWTSTSEGVRSAWLQLWYSSRPNSQGTAGKTNTIHVRAVKRLPVTYEMKGHPLAAPVQAVPVGMEPVYQIGQPFPFDPENTWRDASKDAYDVCMPNRRRIIYTASQTAAVQQDAERYRWLRKYAIGAYITVQGKGSTVIYLLTKAPALDGIGEETDAAIDAARAAVAGFL